MQSSSCLWNRERVRDGYYFRDGAELGGNWVQTLAMNKKWCIAMGACFPASILFSIYFEGDHPTVFCVSVSWYMCWVVGRCEIVYVSDISPAAEMDVYMFVCACVAFLEYLKMSIPVLRIYSKHKKIPAALCILHTIISLSNVLFVQFLAPEFCFVLWAWWCCAGIFVRMSHTIFLSSIFFLLELNQTFLRSFLFHFAQFGHFYKPCFNITLHCWLLGWCFAALCCVKEQQTDH